MSNPEFAQAIHSKAIDSACDDDRTWFEQNPGRLFRIRPPMPYEFNGPLPDPPGGLRDWVAVAEINPGFRLRTLFASTEEIDEHAGDAHIAKLVLPLFPQPFRKTLKKKLRDKRPLKPVR